jgi:hypothetical protein
MASRLRSGLLIYNYINIPIQSQQVANLARDITEFFAVNAKKLSI